MKLAGDAPSIQRADEFLGKALDYMEKENLTQGNSALIFPTPTSNVGIWYQQIKGAKETTENILAREKESPVAVSQLERDNALMKIREVLLDNSSNGTVVTAPNLISWFPMQWLMALWGVFSLILCLFGLLDNNR